MPYEIEVMALGTDVYPLLERASRALNGVQEQFRFRLTAPTQRQLGLAFQRDVYRTPDVWSFLESHRNAVGGHRPYIIAFVDRPLVGTEYGNLFGAHEADDGLAVCTLDGHAQYVREDTRYCCYYLVRYALSFVNPARAAVPQLRELQSIDPGPKGGEKP